MQIPKERAQHVRMLLDKLRDMGISRNLWELLGGWLISRDSESEKEEGLSDIFDDTFSYTIKPSRKAHKSYMRFARANGLVKAETPVRIPLNRRVAFKVAAVLIPAFVLAGSVYLQVEHQAVDSVEQNSAAMVAVSAAARDENDSGTVTIAENGEITLPDKSYVRLGAGSEMRRAENFGENRYVELKGGAHFNVTAAKTASDHFTIHTDHFDIKVLGTDFDVHSPAGDGFSTIDLYHGSIEVEAGGERITMRPTEHLHYDHITKQTAVTNIPYGKLRYDEMPGLVFDHAPVRDAMAVLERDYGIRFRVEGTLPPDEGFIDGDLTSVRSLDELMSKVQKLSGRFTYEIHDDEIKVKIQNIQ